MADIFIGIDPGASGAIAAVGTEGQMLHAFGLDKTDAQVSMFMAALDQTHDIRHCILEHVWSFPGQGVASTFKFGVSFGKCQQLLADYDVDYTLVIPRVWQEAMKCKTGGKKAVTTARAKELWPDADLTQRTADAMLIAEYARRTFLEVTP